MLNFIADNLLTILVFMIIAAMVAAIIRKMISDRKKGISSCGGKCGCCPNSSLCGSNKKASD